MEKHKRTWHYVQKPDYFEIKCPKCSGTNLDWSEYAGHIWCYDCKEDYSDYVSPFSGPVPIEVATILGIDMRIYNMETGEIEEI